MRKNNALEIVRYFQDDNARPISRREFLEFWHSLTEDEQEYYRRVDLKTGLEPLT